MNKITYDIVQIGNMFDAFEYLPNGRFNAKCFFSMGAAIKWVNARKAARK